MSSVLGHVGHTHLLILDAPHDYIQLCYWACCGLSGPVLRDTARLSQRYPPYCALWGFSCLNMANWVRYPSPPPPFSERFPPWRACEVEARYPPPPPQKGYLSDTCATPPKKKQNACDIPLCDTISKGYCAIWGGLSRTGPLRLRYKLGGVLKYFLDKLYGLGVPKQFANFCSCVFLGHYGGEKHT